MEVSAVKRRGGHCAESQSAHSNACQLQPQSIRVDTHVTHTRYPMVSHRPVHLKKVNPRTIEVEGNATGYL